MRVQIIWSEANFLKDGEEFETISKFQERILNNMYKISKQGYDKVKFNLPDEEYIGRMDLTHVENEFHIDSNNNLKEHIAEFLEYMVENEELTEETKKETEEFIIKIRGAK